MKFLSTSALANKLNVPAPHLFKYFESSGMIVKENGKWELTYEGETKGGRVTESKQYGNYVTWPENMKVSLSADNPTLNTLTSTSIGKEFNLSSQKLNAIFSELGWIKKALKGWELTRQGTAQGGQQSEDYKSGVPYVRWEESILSNKVLMSSIDNVTGQVSDGAPKKNQHSSDNFREKFPASFRTTDGHMVRSKAELLIDNWLYMAEIIHAYERKLPIEEDLYCDFYIPTGKLYIEYWGYENDPKYSKRKNVKLDLYEKYNFNLIQLNDEDVQNLDDVFPKLLLKYGVQAY